MLSHIKWREPLGFLYIMYYMNTGDLKVSPTFWQVVIEMRRNFTPTGIFAKLFTGL